jgi:hypothetical protein
MTEEPDFNDELTSEEGALGEHLNSIRLVPAAVFRGALGRYLAERDSGYGQRPRRLRLISLGYIAASALLMTLGALQATGAL